jgi:hypothetical protein
MVDKEPHGKEAMEKVTLIARSLTRSLNLSCVNFWKVFRVPKLVVVANSAANVVPRHKLETFAQRSVSQIISSRYLRKDHAALTSTMLMNECVIWYMVSLTLAFFLSSVWRKALNSSEVLLFDSIENKQMAKSLSQQNHCNMCSSSMYFETL